MFLAEVVQQDSPALQVERLADDVQLCQALKERRQKVRIVEDELPGYDYNAKLEHIENILTKDIYRMPPDKADSIGNDRIDVDNIWLTQNHVNIVYKFYHSNDMNKKHMLNLVIDERQDVADDGYLHLSFRHNAYNDTPLQGGTGIVSFKLDNVRDQLASYKGLCIEVNPLYGEVKDFIVDISAD